MDGAAIVNILKPGTGNTFSDYTSEVFLLQSISYKTPQGLKRLDVVRNEYVRGSIKATMGKGGRRFVESSNALLKNWMDCSFFAISNGRWIGNRNAHITFTKVAHS